MYWPDRGSGVDVEPARRPVQSAIRQYFTEGGIGQPPTVPGGDWFNQITNEVLNVLAAAGIEPSKVDDDQLLNAIIFVSNSKSSYEALRRSLFEAGYLLRPQSESFESGGTLTSDVDVLLQRSTGRAYSGPIGPVSPGTDPTTGGFVYRGEELIISSKVEYLGGSVFDKLESATKQVSDYATLAQVPPTQVGTIDSMGVVTDEILVKSTTTDPLQLCSIRDAGIKAIGTPAGGAAGAVNYYSFIRTGKVGAHIAFNAFDGNGRGTFSAYNPAGVNEWMLPFVLAADRQKAIGNDSVDSCGHAVENTSGANKSLIVALNTARRHNGLGITNVVGYASLGNISDETSDSHITSNSNDNAVIAANIGHSAIAASGCDLAGGTNVAAVGNVFANNQFSGIWALKSPNTGETLNNVNISSHVLSGNTKYPGASNGQGELTLGDYNHKSDFQGKAWFAHGNLIDVSSGTNFSLAAWVHKFVSAPSVSYNYITGVDKPSDATQIIDEGAEYASYVGNIGRTANAAGDYVYSTLYLRTKVPGRGATYANNDGFRIDPQSPVMPEVMHDEDGNWVYSCVKPSAASNYALARFINDGAITPYLIRLTLCKRGNAFGFLEKVLCIQGNSAAGTVVVSNVDKTAEGSAISVSVDVSNPAYSQIVIGAHADAMAIKLEIISPVSDRNHILMFP